MPNESKSYLLNNNKCGIFLLYFNQKQIRKTKKENCRRKRAAAQQPLIEN
jgi:hypothetical protein